MRKIACFSRVFSLLLILCLSCELHAQTANVLPNAGFEDGTTGWSIGDGGSEVIAEAARSGKLGARISNDRTKATGSNLSSAIFPVTEGQKVTLNFWARSDAKGGGLYMMYLNEAGKMVSDPAIKGGMPMAAMKYDDNQWHEYNLTATIPAVAKSFKLWAHTWSTAKVIIDFDDMTLTGLPDDIKPVIPAPYVAKKQEKIEPLDMTNLPKRKTPAVIVLKLDDLKMHRKTQHPRWTKVADYLDSKGVKGTMGILCESLADATPEYCQWIKSHQESGNWEFWFHGWDHKTHKDDDGKTYNEFNHRSYEEQKKRLDDSQKLCLEKLGFALTCFGPPGGVGNGSHDANTHKVMIDDPYMTTWLYPQPFDKLGKETNDAGKITILDRVWAVNLEAAVGRPDFERFVRGYIKNLDRPYFVLQGHPVMWDDYSFEQFTKIIDFLIEQKAVFVLPSQYTASLKKM